MTEAKSIHATRLAAIRAHLEQAGLDALVLNAGPSLRYFSGMDFHLMERPTVMYIKAGRGATFVLPDFEKAKLEALDYEFRMFTYREDPAQWNKSFSAASEYLELAGGQVGVEDTRLRFLELSYLQAGALQAKFVSGLELIAKLRERKGPEEVELMRRAVQVAEQALVNTLEAFEVGQTEQEIAARLVQELLTLGSLPELPFQPIVASGPNSANPHAGTSGRQVQAGELLLIDWGANVDGYYSDITRTFAVSQIDDELHSIYRAVQAANQAGREQVAPGVSCGSVDQAARSAIEEAGFGEFFTHRTGHGLGLETHETPYIRAGNAMKLQPGMTFTVEPGIYLPSKGGVRIEDDVVVTENGAETLTTLPRDLQILG